MQSLQSTRKAHLCFLLLSLATALVILHPFLDFQSRFAQGDHGHNLYSYYLTYQGETPYRDYWYAYGPLMPFVYGGLFHLADVSVKTIIFGDLIFTVLSGLFLYACMAVFSAPFLAYVATVCFWVFNHGFFYTYNHTAGIVLLLAGVYAVFSFINTENRKFLWAAQLLFAVLCFVKLNIGLCNLVALGGFILMYKLLYPARINVWQDLIMPFLAALGLVTLLYSVFFWGLPDLVVKHCVPLFSNTYQRWREFNTPLYFLQTLFKLGFQSWQSSLFSILVLVSAGYFLKRTVAQRAFQAKEFIALIAAGIFLLVNSHEFLAGEVVNGFRWICPFLILISFLLIGFSRPPLPAPGVILIYFVLLGCAVDYVIREHATVRSFKSPAHYLKDPRLRIYTRNSSSWIASVEGTTAFLKGNLKGGEKFFAMPYDALYYFLLDRKSPVWEIMITEEAGITPEQELRMIQDLEDPDVRFVVISNRAFAGDRFIGVFGQTYLPRLYQFIMDNFREVATFGDWSQPPEWIENHAVKIFERNR